MLRNNYDRMVKVISHELSGAQHPTGAQNQTQSHVAGTDGSDGAGGLANGQQPQSVPTACFIDKGVKHNTPPSGNKWSLVCRRNEGLKWRDRSHAIDHQAQWTKQYNGIRYLMQYVHWQTFRPRLKPISEWEERVVNEELTRIA